MTTATVPTIRPVLIRPIISLLLPRIVITALISLLGSVMFAVLVDVLSRRP